MNGWNKQGAGKAAPSPMYKSHSGLGNHKQRLTSEGAVKGNATGSPKTSHTGQPRGTSKMKDNC